MNYRGRIADKRQSAGGVSRRYRGGREIHRRTQIKEPESGSARAGRVMSIRASEEEERTTHVRRRRIRGAPCGDESKPITGAKRAGTTTIRPRKRAGRAGDGCDIPLRACAWCAGQARDVNEAKPAKRGRRTAGKRRETPERPRALGPWRDLGSADDVTCIIDESLQEQAHS